MLVTSTIGSQHTDENKRLEREVYLTGLIEVTVKVDFPMERYSSIKPFGFAMSVIGSKIRPTTVNKLAMTPSLVTLDMFALVVPFFLLFYLQQL